MKGSEVIVKSLIKQGVTTTFGITGGAVIPLFDTFLEYKDEISNILTRHEQGAAHAAEGFARASGKAGVCIATSGPGATNLVTGIMDAYMDSVPIVAFAGQVPTSLIGNDAFQETDMMGITLPITKHNFQIRKADDAAEIIMKAFKLAKEGRPGPVYIDLPKDIQTQETKKPIPEKVDIQGFQPTFKGHVHQLKRAAEMILNAERPIFIIGGGVIHANASKELFTLIELVKAPVTTTLLGKGAFPENHPLALGMLGMHGRKIANYAVLNSDLIIAIGCRFSDRITGNLQSFAEKSKVIHIDIDPAEIGKNVKVDLPIVGDAKLVIIDLMKEIKKLAKKSKSTAWQKRIKELNVICKCNISHKNKPIEPRKIIDELNKIKKPDDIVCTGVGQHQMFAAHFLRVTKPRTFISSGGSGTMGFGLPAAMGAKVARPDVEVYDIDGDGSFGMVIQELGTLKENNIKVIPIIMNNTYLGMVAQWLRLFFGKRYSQVDLKRTPNFEKIADAYGLNGITVERASEVAKVLKEAKKNDETTVIDVHVEPESNILPMLPPGGHLREAFGGCMKAPGEFF
jgi:acetolactate synthase-1/2/3 large subunit